MKFNNHIFYIYLLSEIICPIDEFIDELDYHDKTQDYQSGSTFNEFNILQHCSWRRVQLSLKAALYELHYFNKNFAKLSPQTGTKI